MTIDLSSVHRRMLAAVAGDGRAPALYAYLRYHLGWADEQGRAVEQRSAKGFRPRLLLLACEAVGGDPGDAVPAASAIELTHEFSLIHDDIQDGDGERRGRPALWSRWGAPQGITAGDALFAIARRELGEVRASPAVLVDLYRRYDAACLRLAEGQHLDIDYETRARIGLDDYLSMVAGKTGALLGAAAGIGALVGGAPPATADRLTGFGEALGVAFQIRDDVLGLWGDPDVTGKPVGSDLLRRKKALPVVLAWSVPGLADRVDRLFAEPAPTATAAAALSAAMEAAGCRAHADALARHWAESARGLVDELDLAAGPRDELGGLVARAVARDR